jgi:WD40 repeat protein/serine/threonine protein kinase/tetratricopeptide (TPR) repeat protein
MDYRREYLVRLPLPLAQLYSRAFNAKDPRSRHDNAFYLFEATIKLAAAPVAACYVQDVRRGGTREPQLDRLLLQLALPSLGQWVAILRELSRQFTQRPDAASHPFGHLWSQLTEKQRDRSGLLALYRRIKGGVDGKPVGDESCSILDVLDALVQYRNSVFGHGGPRFESFFEKEMGPLLLPAANDLLEENAFEFLGPRGSRLVYLTDLRTIDEVKVEIGLRELVGRDAERLAPLVVARAEAENLLPNRVCVLWPGAPVPLRLDPLLMYRESETAEEVLFLNRDRNQRQVEYLSYASGRTERDKSTVPEMCRLLSTLAGREISGGDLERLAEQSAAETPSLEAFSPPRVVGQRQGDYEILAEIGRGGMGVVYLARQLSLGRLVALKMLPADLAGDAVALARFRREIQHLARCEHPNIVKVLASGAMPDGWLFYTMEYVPGCDLEMVWQELGGGGAAGFSTSRLGQSTWAEAVLSASRKRREKTAHCPPTESQESARQVPDVPTLPLPPLPELPSSGEDPGGYGRRVCQLIRDAALALQAVHEQKLVHRDVKPSNLMLTPDGSRIVLMDFGLVKGESLALTASRSAGFLGTLRYAAPEQLASATIKVGPQADVRGLGCVLWELLTGSRLFVECQDEAALATKVLQADVPRLRSVDPGFDRDLEAIVGRATERRIEDRIQTAGQLAQYLQIYLDRKPLPIRPPTGRELLVRWCRLNALAASLLAAVAILLLVGSVGATTLAIITNQNAERADRYAKHASEEAANAKMARDDAVRNAERADRNADRASDEAQKAHAAQAIAENEKAQVETARAESDRRRKEAQAERDRAEAALRDQAAARLDAEHQREAAKIAAQREKDQRLAAEEAARLARAREFATRAVPFLEGSRNRQTALGWALASVRAHYPPLDDALTVLYGAVQSNNLKYVIPARGLEPEEWAWSPDGEIVAAVGRDGDMRLWTAKGKVVAILDMPPTDRIRKILWSPDSRALLAVTSEDTAFLWNRGGKLLATIALPFWGWRNVAWSPTGRSFLVAAEGSTDVRLWDASGQLLAAPVHEAGRVQFAGWAANDSRFATLTEGEPDGQMLRLWDESGRCLWQRTVNKPAVRTMGWVPNQALLWGSDGGRALRIWEVSGELISTWPNLEKDVNELHWSPRGEAVITSHDQRKSWRLWNRQGKALTPLIPAPGLGRLLQIAWSPDGRRFAICYFGSRTASLWSIDGKLLATLGGAILADNAAKMRGFAVEPPEHGSAVKELIWSPDSQVLATLSDAQSCLWDADGFALAQLGNRQQPIVSSWSNQRQQEAYRAVWSPQARWLAVLFAGGLVQILDREGESVAEIVGIPSRASLAWSPDGTNLIVENNGVQFHDPGDQPMVTLRGHLHPVRFLTWQPGGSCLVTATSDEEMFFDAHGRERLDQRFAIWDDARRVRTSPAEFTSPIASLAWSPTGQTIAFLERKARMDRWSHGVFWMLDSSGRVMTSREQCDAFDWRPDGRGLALAEQPGVIRLTDAAGRPLAVTENREGRVADLSWNPTGTVLASQHYRGTPEEVARAIHDNWRGMASSDICLWDAGAHRIAELNLLDKQVFQMGWSPDGELLLTLGERHSAEIWTKQGVHYATLNTDRAMRNFAWNSNSSVLATSEGDGLMRVADSKPQAIRLWNREGKHIATLAGHQGPIQQLLWHPRLPLLASAGYDGKIRLWKGDGKALYQLEGHEGPVVRLAWSPDGKLLASLSRDNTVRLWDGEGKPVATLTRIAWSRFPLAMRTNAVLSYSEGGLKPSQFELVWSPDGKRLAATFNEPTARVWLTDFQRLYQEAQARLIEQANWVTAERARPVWKPDVTHQWWESLPPRDHHESIEDLRQEASSLADQSRWGAAVDVLGAALELRPGQTDLLRCRGDAFVAMGDQEKAAADYQAVLAKEPANVEVRLRLGHVYTMLRERERALEEIERAVELDRADHNGQLTEAGRAAYSLFEEGEYRDTEEQLLHWLQKAVRYDARHRSAYAKKAVAILLRTARKDPAGALDACNKVLPSFKNDAFLLDLRGKLAGALGRNDEAVRSFTEALKQDTVPVDVWEDRGYTYADSGLWKEAIADFEVALKHRPHKLGLWTQYGLAQVGKGDLTAFRQTCEQLLKRVANSYRLNDGVAVAYLCCLRRDAVSDPSALVKMLEGTTAVGPERFDYLETLGAALYRAGKVPAAQERLEKAVKSQRNGGSVWTQLFLAMSCHQLAKHDDANKWLMKAVKRIDQIERSGQRLSWSWRVQLRVLREEAEALLQKPLPSAPVSAPPVGDRSLLPQNAHGERWTSKDQRRFDEIFIGWDPASKAKIGDELKKLSRTDRDAAFSDAMKIKQEELEIARRRKEKTDKANGHN